MHRMRISEYNILNNISGNVMTISGDSWKPSDKEKENDATNQRQEDVCILVNLFTKLCGPRRVDDVIITKDSLQSYQKDNIHCTLREAK